MRAPTINVNGHELELPYPGDIIATPDGITIESPFGTWHLIATKNEAPRWELMEAEWVVQSRVQDAFRSDLREYLADRVADGDERAGDLLDRLRKVQL